MANIPIWTAQEARRKADLVATEKSNRQLRETVSRIDTAIDIGEMSVSVPVYLLTVVIEALEQKGYNVFIPEDNGPETIIDWSGDNA